MAIPPFPDQFDLQVRNAKIDEQLHIIQAANVHGELNVAGAVHLENSFRLDGSLSVAGAGAFAANLSALTMQLAVPGIDAVHWPWLQAGADARVVLEGSLQVTADTVVDGVLTVTRGATLGGDLQVAGNLNVTGALNATAIQQNGAPLRLSQWQDGDSGISYTGDNVGIGTAQPQNKLHVYTPGIHGSHILAGDHTLTLKGVNDPVAYHPALPYIQWLEGTDVRAMYLGWGQTSGPKWIDLGLENGYNLSITGGNVGIGTAAPEAALDVRGAIRAGNSDLYFTKTDHAHTGVGNQAGYAAIENAANFDALMILGRAGTAQGRSVRLWDYLQVNGNLDVTGQIRGQLAGLDVAPNFTAFVRCADFVIGGIPGRGHPRRAMVAWESVLEINHNGDWPRVTIQNLANGSSQERKENITQLTLQAAQQVLHQLNPVEFSVKTDPEHQLRSGFIAEESPNLVATSDHKAIFVDGIVAILTKVVQQQCLEITALKSQLTALHEKVYSSQPLM